MEFSHIIVRYGELTLKSGNRNEFLKKLTKNIRYNLEGLTGFHVQTKRDRMYIHLDHNEDVHEINRNFHFIEESIITTAGADATAKFRVVYAGKNNIFFGCLSCLMHEFFTMVELK